ncbi:spike base protein, RCAP_Rcc01079 family [Ancylobacter mangrovi]|uniref:Uncharacterized protein n=1 Tax=Ancylobacter mangrovi TaxID=2972472 RepID=A0A9X2P8T6_9HYPH|nr:hypothetical protein [Ancylobacter mangrovi]MCS0494174.1 hypothetical protein [Ancylobacter mangrovi]MCS0501099.1 hypothetical protein [Ancylobacter mangrovi]
MPYDPARDPWRGSAVSPTSLGRAGAAVTPSDDADLERYARIRVFAPAALESAEVSILPLDAADGEPLTLPVPVGLVSVLEFLVRRVLATGTTPGLIIHTVN